jgi:hypothetical protein
VVYRRLCKIVNIFVVIQPTFDARIVDIFPASRITNVIAGGSDRGLRRVNGSRIEAINGSRITRITI